MYPSRLHAAGMCMCVSCDPGQVLLLLGLFAENSDPPALRPATIDIDRNCSSPNSCCSAFHSSIVKVFPVEMGRSRSPLFDALHFSSGHFVRLFTVDVLSHISGAVSRGFQANFSLLRKLPSLAFAGTETFPGLTTTQKKSYETLVGSFT